MTLPYDGRSRPTPVYREGALPPDEFETEFCESMMRTALAILPQPGMPPGIAPAAARRYHGTFLKYFSFFAWKFPSWLMAVATQCPYIDVRKEIIEDCVDEEVGDPDAAGKCHIDVLYDEAEAVGISRDEIYAARPTPPIVAAIHAWENLARTLGWVPGFAAIAGLEIIHSEPAIKARVRLTSADQAEKYAQNLGGKAFHERLGVEEGALKFLALHSYKDRFHGGGELALLVKYANTRSLQEESLWAMQTSLQIMAVHVTEVLRLASEAAGFELDPSWLSQAEIL